jgi:hypothetical protein
LAVFAETATPQLTLTKTTGYRNIIAKPNNTARPVQAFYAGLLSKGLTRLKSRFK